MLLTDAEGQSPREIHLLTNPYVAARERTITDRQVLGAKITGWQIATGCCLLFILLQHLHIRQIQGQHRVEPIFGQFDQTGLLLMTRALGTNEQEVPMALALPAAIQKWLIDARSVTSDPYVQKQQIDRVYAQVTEAARKVVDEWYEKRNPMLEGALQTIGVRVTALVPLSENSWELRWEEIPRARNGRELPEAKHAIKLTVTHEEPTSAEEALLNLVGLRIVEIVEVL